MTKTKRNKDKEHDASDAAYTPDEVRYLKKPKLEPTRVENPIQGRVFNPDVLYHFMRDVQDEAVPKMWAIYLDKDRFSLGNEPIAIGDQAQPDKISMKTLASYALMFYASYVVLLTNHPDFGAAPTEEDRKLIWRAQEALKLVEIQLTDYVIVSDKHYWSMTRQDGTACRCGAQHYMGFEEEP